MAEVAAMSKRSLAEDPPDGVHTAGAGVDSPGRTYWG